MISGVQVQPNLEIIVKNKEPLKVRDYEQKMDYRQKNLRLEKLASLNLNKKASNYESSLDTRMMYDKKVLQLYKRPHKFQLIGQMPLSKQLESYGPSSPSKIKEDSLSQQSTIRIQNPYENQKEFAPSNNSQNEVAPMKKERFKESIEKSTSTIQLNLYENQQLIDHLGVDPKMKMITETEESADTFANQSSASMIHIPIIRQFEMIPSDSNQQREILIKNHSGLQSERKLYSDIFEELALPKSPDLENDQKPIYKLSKSPISSLIKTPIIENSSSKHVSIQQVDAPDDPYGGGQSSTRTIDEQIKLEQDNSYSFQQNSQNVTFEQTDHQQLSHNSLFIPEEIDPLKELNDLVTSHREEKLLKQKKDEKPQEILNIIQKITFGNKKRKSREQARFVIGDKHSSKDVRQLREEFKEFKSLNSDMLVQNTKANVVQINVGSIDILHQQNDQRSNSTMLAVQNVQNEQSPNDYERMELDKAKQNLQRKEFQFSELVTRQNRISQGTNIVTIQSSDQNQTNVKTEEFISDFKPKEPLLRSNYNQFRHNKNSARNQDFKKSGSAIKLDKDDISMLNQIMNAQQFDDQNVITLNSSRGAKPLSSARNSDYMLKQQSPLRVHLSSKEFEKKNRYRSQSINQLVQENIQQIMKDNVYGYQAQYRQSKVLENQKNYLQEKFFRGKKLPPRKTVAPFSYDHIVRDSKTVSPIRPRGKLSPLRKVQVLYSKKILDHSEAIRLSQKDSFSREDPYSAILQPMNLAKKCPSPINSKIEPIKSVKMMNNIEIHGKIDSLIESNMQSIETETKQQSPHNVLVMPPVRTNNTNQDIHSSFNLTRNNEENKTHTNEPTHTEGPPNTHTGGPVTIDVNKDMISNNSINHSSTKSADLQVSSKMVKPARNNSEKDPYDLLNQSHGQKQQVIFKQSSQNQEKSKVASSQNHKQNSTPYSPVQLVQMATEYPRNQSIDTSCNISQSSGKNIMQREIIGGENMSIDSMFMNQDIILKSRSNINVDSMFSKKNASLSPQMSKQIDKIILKQSKADEIRNLCKKIELLQLKGVHSNRTQSQDISPRGIQLLKQMNETLKPPQFLTKVLGMQRAYKDMTNNERLILNNQRRTRLNIEDRRYKLEKIRRLQNNQSMFAGLDTSQLKQHVHQAQRPFESQKYSKQRFIESQNKLVQPKVDSRVVSSSFQSLNNWTKVLTKKSARASFINNSSLPEQELNNFKSEHGQQETQQFKQVLGKIKDLEEQESKIQSNFLQKSRPGLKKRDPKSVKKQKTQYEETQLQMVQIKNQIRAAKTKIKNKRDDIAKETENRDYMFTQRAELKGFLNKVKEEKDKVHSSVVREQSQSSLENISVQGVDRFGKDPVDTEFEINQVKMSRKIYKNNLHRYYQDVIDTANEEANSIRQWLQGSDIISSELKQTNQSLKNKVQMYQVMLREVQLQQK